MRWTSCWASSDASPPVSNTQRTCDGNAECLLSRVERLVVGEHLLEPGGMGEVRVARRDVQVAAVHECAASLAYRSDPRPERLLPLAAPRKALGLTSFAKACVSKDGHAHLDDDDARYSFSICFRTGKVSVRDERPRAPARASEPLFGEYVCSTIKVAYSHRMTRPSAWCRSPVAIGVRSSGERAPGGSRFATATSLRVSDSSSRRRKRGIVS